jgi:gentisate 1,2-dioxygenase
MQLLKIREAIRATFSEELFWKDWWDFPLIKTLKLIFMEEHDGESVEMGLEWNVEIIEI